MTINIFISYRRDDSKHQADRIYRALQEAMPAANLFMDIHIPMGEDFIDSIENSVEKCEVMFVLVGSNWAGVDSRTGQCRLDNPEDFVRIEVRKALARKICVIPVLLDGAAMPDKDTLPEDIRAIARRQHISVVREKFAADVSHMVESLAKMTLQNKITGGKSDKKPSKTGAVGLIVPADIAASRLRSVELDKFQQGVSNHWSVYADRSVRAQSVLWLFCWAKYGGGSKRIEIETRSIFSEILDCSFDEFDMKVGYVYAKTMRYAAAKLEKEIERRLGR